jgi:hypothetical protein
MANLLQNPKVHYYVHNGPPPVSWSQQVHTYRHTPFLHGSKFHTSLSIVQCLSLSKESIQVRGPVWLMLVLYGERLSAPPPPPQIFELRDLPIVLNVSGCLFNSSIFAASPHISQEFSPSPRTLHAAKKRDPLNTTYIFTTEFRSRFMSCESGFFSLL